MSASPATETLNACGRVSSPRSFDRKNTKSVLSDIFGTRRSGMTANSSSIASSAGDNSREDSALAAPAPPKSNKGKRVPTLIRPQLRFYN
ncbi:Uncharacterized protein TCAP_04340 [Tolypocladium capitatum]|uniref:Uncharacterized protein n=1 Tax=Tolypocladium capitatum TaxID=45235 RepID=A0A2K3QDX0_9HYPO|nr:Uncharacterized protein TCAP_04340 [Tolypocladium capitatum]